MNDSGFFVEILNRVRDLADDMSAEIFAKVGQSHDLMKQFTPGAKFKDYVIVLGRLREVDQFDDIGVVEVAHNLYFFENIRTLSKHLG